MSKLALVPAAEMIPFFEQVPIIVVGPLGETSDSSMVIRGERSRVTCIEMGRIAPFGRNGTTPVAEYVVSGVRKKPPGPCAAAPARNPEYEPTPAINADTWINAALFTSAGGKNGKHESALAMPVPASSNVSADKYRATFFTDHTWLETTWLPASILIHQKSIDQ